MQLSAGDKAVEYSPTVVVDLWVRVRLEMDLSK